MSRITLQSMLEAYENDRLSKADFLESVEMLVKKLDERMGRDKGELDTSLTFMAGKFNEFRAEIEATAKEKGDSLTASEQGYISRLEAKMSEWEASINKRISELKDGPEGKQGEQGMPGLNGSPDTTEEIIIKLLLPVEEDEKLPISAVGHLREELDKMWKEHKSRTSFVGGGGSMRVQQTILDAAETPDGIITTFSFAQKPLMIVVNGSNYREGHGWTWTNEQAVIDFAPVTDSDIYAIL